MCSLWLECDWFVRCNILKTYSPCPRRVSIPIFPKWGVEFNIHFSFPCCYFLCLAHNVTIGVSSYVSLSCRIWWALLLVYINMLYHLQSSCCLFLCNLYLRIRWGELSVLFRTEQVTVSEPWLIVDFSVKGQFLPIKVSLVRTERCISLWVLQ